MSHDCTRDQYPFNVRANAHGPCTSYNNFKYSYLLHDCIKPELNFNIDVMFVTVIQLSFMVVQVQRQLKPKKGAAKLKSTS